MMLAKTALVFIITATGTASQYAPRVMDKVVYNRQHLSTSFSLPGELPNVHGYVATRDCSDIGKIVYLRPANCEDCGFERFLVADCAGVADGGLSWMVRNNILVEVDYETALRWNTVGRGIKVELAIEDLEKEVLYEDCCRSFARIADCSLMFWDNHSYLLQPEG